MWAIVPPCGLAAISGGGVQGGQAMAEEVNYANQRIVLLNTMIARSTTRARDHHAPTVGALECLDILEQRRKKKWAVEFFGLDEKAIGDENTSPADFEAVRIKKGEGLDCVRLRHLRIEKAKKHTYATLLVETIDVNAKSFPVVHVETFNGREISGESKERGATTAHLVVRIPAEGDYDDGAYRCAIESVHPITRTEIETLLCRQLRRHADAIDLRFTVQVQDKAGKPEQKHYRYNPRLDLNADVGRGITIAQEDRTLSHMVFIKRSEKEVIGKGTAVDHEEFLADVEIRIAASQAPKPEEQKRTWLQKVQDWYRKQGYEVRLYFRHANGGVIGGDVHKAIAGAADLIMCHREPITLSKPPKRWVSQINDEIESALRGLVDRDELWVRHNK